MSSSYVKYTMIGDSQRPLLRCKTHRPQSTVAECIMTIAIRLLVEKRGKSPTPKKTRIPHTNK